MLMRYAMTRAGQVHVRDWGAPTAPLLMLLHWTPLSGRMFEALGPALAARGWRVLAPDLPGYGRSAPRGADWQVEDWAAAMADVVGDAGPESVMDAVVLGGHLGASVATEMALGWPDRVRALVLDGCPFLTPELRAVLLGMAKAPRPSGEGLERLAWDRVAGVLKEYGVPAEPDRMWPLMIDYLETGFVSSGPVLAAHDLRARLPQLTHPVLLLGAEGDSLGPSLDVARALLPAARWHRFHGPDPVHFTARLDEYLAPLCAFLEEL